MILWGRTFAAPVAKIFVQNTIKGQNALVIICRGTSLTFTDSSTNATSRSWVFKNGTPATST